MFCNLCILSYHQCNPLHHIKQWNGTFFEHRSLKDLGLRIQLGHPVGEKCCWPRGIANDDFVVIHSNGVQNVNLDFCGCKTAEMLTRQLFHMCWFPASSDKPCTAATFTLLEQYHLLSFESKVSAYEYYHALAHLSDNMTLSPDRYEQFMRMAREWQHLKLLKCSGRGHDPTGVAGTKQGECAVLCPVCPHPDKNLPSGWQGVAKDKSYLYSLFVAIDANFQLKRKAVWKDSVDPSFSQGWAYFVEECAYKTHLSKHIKDLQEKNSCSSHNAANMADTKSTKGLAATGVGAMECTRHNLKRPSGTGGLQVGKKYINMDWMFFSTVKNTNVKVLKVSYDIACQWHKGLWGQMEMLPEYLQLDHKGLDITFLVPKFHLPAHITPCQSLFSFNWSPGMGCTDGEALERGWANINPMASSTKEMGPGHHHDTLDNHFSDWNWKKVISLGPWVLCKIQEAIPERNEHIEDYHELTQSLKVKYPKLLSQWQCEVEEWENDPSKPNPFVVKTESPLHPDVTPSVLIGAGIDLEDQRRRLYIERAKLGQHTTDTQKTKVQQQSNGLMRHLEAWAKIQTLFIPGVASLRSMDSQSTTEKPPTPEDFDFHLPSQVCRSVACPLQLEQIEWQLRKGQAYDALDELHQALRSHSYMLKFKDQFLCGQGPNIRARNCLKSVDNKVNASAVKYCAAHNALSVLSELLKIVGWSNTFPALANDDICAMTEGMNDSSEGRRTLSWIWKSCKKATEDELDEGLQDAIHLEWCKTRARANRRSEEAQLLFEEKHHILAFFNWHVKWWSQLTGTIETGDEAYEEGLRAYVQRKWWDNVATQGGMQCSGRGCNADNVATQGRDAMQWKGMQHNRRCCNTTGGDAIQREGMQYNGRGCNTMGGDAIQREGMQYNGRGCNAMEGDATLFGNATLWKGLQHYGRGCNRTAEYATQGRGMQHKGQDAIHGQGMQHKKTECTML
ncbi:hypothetical protein PAXINDRAFT_164080 [Paxillus involutus ATCC 200175]|uniref:CxC2-like cysteine cluster KDZ transposase-associated domain-containing protein n=1 Tax=Paxillus involutus ATCC 200175 TaxID=664439 RepID=A0A0C9T7K1_PAXIN|nr:hypothetical protein PAXINDRAFT_164080 [Paxillus involutus ATCC 200175]